MANSIDSDESTHNELSHLALLCLQRYLAFVHKISRQLSCPAGT